jgi:ABC-type lipoprotein release transport system permease subunit
VSVTPFRLLEFFLIYTKLEVSRVTCWRDPLVLVGTVLTMSLLGLVATWIPAQRALSIDPAILLREE